MAGNPTQNYINSLSKEIQGYQNVTRGNTRQNPDITDPSTQDQDNNNVGSMIQAALEYLKPTGNGGKNIWTSPVGQAAAKAEEISQIPLPHSNNAQYIDNPIGKFFMQILEGITNSPYNAQQSSIDLGRGINEGNLTPQRTFADAAGIAQLPLTIASFGAAAPAKAATSAGGAIAQGALTGAKYGAGFGLTSGLQAEKDNPDLTDYYKKILSKVLVGAATGAGGGAITQGAGYGLRNAVEGPLNPPDVLNENGVPQYIPPGAIDLNHAAYTVRGAGANNALRSLALTPEEIARIMTPKPNYTPLNYNPIPVGIK